MFVALTLNADLILTGERAHLKHIAEQAFQNYAVVLLSALLFVMPHESWRQLSAMMTAIGAAMAAWVAYRIVRTRRTSDDHFGLRRTLRRLLPSLAAYGLIAYAGVREWNAPQDAVLTMFALASIVLLAVSTTTSWDLLLRVAEIRHLRDREKGSA